MMLPSGNDAATVIAENIGYFIYVLQRRKAFKEVCENDIKDSSRNICPLDYFLKEMNTEAKKLRLKGTWFANPHGLPVKANKSSAADIGILACHAMKIPLIREITSRRTF
jgi:D-alanyl-D-alanine carboxypeptidase